MAATERITMTMRELDRLKVIQDVVDGRLKPLRAAERLGLTTRQIRRLVGRFREHGPDDARKLVRNSARKRVREVGRQACPNLYRWCY